MRLIILGIILSLMGHLFHPGMAMAERCDEWVVKATSVKGSVEVRRAGQTQWMPVQQHDAFCAGDVIRVLERSILAIAAQNGTNHRLDANTTITITEPEQKQTFLLNLRQGAAYFFSRLPRSLKVITPFANAGVEGTEFFVNVERDQTFLSVFEGRVTATNAAGSLTLASGQSAIVKAGQAPALRVVVRPRDAVQWALYYPPIVDFRPADFPGEAAWQAMVRRSIQFYREGNLAMAFAAIAGIPEDVRDPRFFTYRSVLMLSVGRVDEAKVDIERALRLDPRHGPAFAVRSVIAVAQNNKVEALRHARTAIELDPASATARVVLSYAQQADFDLKSSLATLQEAVELAPDNALVWARLAEIWLSFGELNKALQAAQKAVKLHPNLALTQTVLGFAYLTQIKMRDAKKAFEQAIQLDQADPLPRLGLGLAKIRKSGLEPGREEIEIAVSLDPNNSLARSYLGKAYYEEKRDRLAEDQFAIAKELDSNDPTPWFYDAIRKQSVNRPVEALRDLQKSIGLNDNRVVYRSRLLLDEDLGARSASLAKIYDDLGFQQLALVEGWKSLNIDPSSYSAHRFLADSYAILPRHEIARVSELLQAQLLQPINITPVQPQLAASDLFILNGTGPADASWNEFNPLFNRNRFALLVSTVAGSDSTYSDEVVFSGIWNKISYSLGQFHYETQGFRANNDLTQDIYNVFAQVSLTHKTSLQAEFRSTSVEKGDLALRFDPQNFSQHLRQEERIDSFRLGFRHAFAPHSDIIVSVIYRSADFETDFGPGDRLTTEDSGYLGEVQHLLRWGGFSIIGGVGHFDQDRKDVDTLFATTEERDIRHTNIYGYSQINYPKDVTLTIGLSADLFEGGILDRSQINPKFGLIWNPFPATTLRAAVFRTLERTLISNQTIEPTQVAGFNQFFRNGEGTDAWRYGIAIDQTFSANIYAGVEYSSRILDIPFINADGQIRELHSREHLGRAYLYWTPQAWLALSTEYQYEQFKQPRRDVDKLRTHRLPLELNFFHPSGFIGRLKATYVDQEGDFFRSDVGFVPGDDRFWVVDSAISYRLPKRWGLITIEARNLLDQRFRFQDTDPGRPTIYPERLILARLTLAY